MVAQVNNQAGKSLQTLSQEPGETLSKYDGLISDAQFLEMCRQDETVREIFSKLFDQLEAEASSLALSSDGNQG